MSLPGQVANWLFNVIQPQYVNKEVVYSDIYRFLALHYRQNLNFKVRTKVYTSPDSGRAELLLQLYGSLLVKEVQVPIEVWIPLQYPRDIPVVYVIPDLAKHLYIKPNNHVDSSGKFYHPYLTEWYNNYSNNLNLIGLVDTVYEEFGRDVPVTNVQSEAPKKPVKYSESGSERGGLNGERSAFIPQSTLNGQTTGLSLNRQFTSPPLNRQTTGPPIPAKPQANLDSHQANRPNQFLHQSNQANASHQPIQANASHQPIPRKYQQPLPIPPQSRFVADTIQGRTYTPQQDYQGSGHGGYGYQSPNNDARSIPSPIYQSPNRQIHSPDYQSNYQSGRQIQSPYQSNHDSQNSYTPSPNQNLPFPIKSPADMNHHPISPPVASPPLDLIDSQEKPGISSNKQLLMELSQKINQALVQENHHELIPKIAENSTKVEVLYSQLSHHYEQAKANSENLNYHITYLTKQVENLTKFNQDLQKLQLVNDKQPAKININPTTSFELNELVTPDSILVKQLYDVVSEIKAIKDSINLIGGSFPQASELINDQNVDTCVKTVRGLSRELFWLELTKNEIAKIMQLKE